MKNLPGINIVKRNGFEVTKISEKEEMDEFSRLLSTIDEPIAIIDKLSLSKQYVKKIKHLCKKIITISR